MMVSDPILAEVWKLREEYIAKFNDDWDAIFEDLKANEGESLRKGQQIVSFCSEPNLPVKAGSKIKKRKAKKNCRGETSLTPTHT